MAHRSRLHTRSECAPVPDRCITGDYWCVEDSLGFFVNAF
jgi:hypothetical protein